MKPPNKFARRKKQIIWIIEFILRIITGRVDSVWEFLVCASLFAWHFLEDDRPRRKKSKKRSLK